MTIVVIGHLCLDLIHQIGGEEARSYGGIYFSVAALANLLGPSDHIVPVFGVGRNEYDALMEQLKPYSNVDTSCIYKFNGSTNQVELTYTTQSQRVECSHYIAEPIPWKKIRPQLDDADLVLVNMISGFDMTLETLDEIRMAVREKDTPIYLDVHSLTLGITNEFIRFHRPVETWRRWLFMLHTVHLNEEEAATLSPEPLDEASLVKHALSLNTKALQITRGERGCSLFLSIHKVIQRHDIPAIYPEKAVDSTGCGDVFAAAYCAHYVQSRDILASTKFANQVAGFKAQLVGSSDIDRLSEFRLPATQPMEKTL